MPDEVKDEGSKGEEELGSLPTPNVSAGSTDAGSAQPGTDVSEVLKEIKALKESLPDMIDARVKSDKDIRFNRVHEDLDSLKSLIEASGGDFSKVAPELRDREILDRLDRLEGSGGDRGGSPPSDLEAVAAKILSKAGIKFDDQLVTDWANQNFVTERDAVEALSSAVVKRSKQDADVPAAAAAGQSGSAAGVSDDVDEIAKELSELQHSSDPFSPENMARRAELHEKLNELDPQMNINNIIPDFGDLHRGAY